MEIGLECLRMHFVEGRKDCCRLFEQHGGGAEAFDRARIRLPDRIENWMVMSGQGIFFKI